MKIVEPPRDRNVKRKQVIDFNPNLTVELKALPSNTSIEYQMKGQQKNGTQNIWGFAN